MGLAQAANVIKDPSKLKQIFGLVPNLISDIIIDVLIDETPLFDFELTEHPVEAGLDITDSRIARPKGLILECAFTDAAFDPASLVKGLISGNLSLSTWQDKKAALYKLKDSNDVITVSTPLDDYNNMEIVSIRPNQRKDTGRAFFFRIEFREVRIVSTDIAYVDPSQIPQKQKKKKKEKHSNADKKKGDKLNKGGVAPTEAPKGAASILQNILNAASGG